MSKPLTSAEQRKQEIKIAQFIMGYKPSGDGGWIDRDGDAIGVWVPHQIAEHALALQEQLSAMCKEVSLSFGDYGAATVAAIAHYAEEDFIRAYSLDDPCEAIVKLALKMHDRKKQDKLEKGGRGILI